MYSDERMTVELDLNVDGQPSLILLYSPEENQYKDPNMYLWVRRCMLFVTYGEMITYLNSLGLQLKTPYRHYLFPELTVIEEANRPWKWYVERAPIHGNINRHQ